MPDKRGEWTERENAAQWEAERRYAEGEPMVNTYRVFYRFENDDTEYSALVDETSEEAAGRALMAVEPVTIVRVERA